MAITRKYQRLLSRRAPEEDRKMIKFSEAFEREPGEATRYLIGAMAPVAHRYTQRLIEQGDRVENQLQKRLSEEYSGLAFRRQGSVSNHTHIRFHSDVDVLVIIDKFETLEHPQVPANPYKGNPVDDLLNLRSRCAEELATAFPVAEIDNDGSSCVTIEGGSLVCAVDAVPANWFNTNAWAQSRQDHLRGIQVYNREIRKRVKNYPFLFNYRIEANDRERNHIPRCLIRLLKNVKADHENEVGEEGEIEFSSFDICSLVYRMPIEYLGTTNEPLRIILGLLEWMYAVLKSEKLRGSLVGVDDSRMIFDTSEKTQGINILLNDLNAFYGQALWETPSRSVITNSHLTDGKV